jgi:hypothetical protein
VSTNCIILGSLTLWADIHLVIRGVGISLWLWSSKICAKKACDLSSDSLARTIRFDVLPVTRSASSTALCFPSFVQQNSWHSFPSSCFSSRQNRPTLHTLCRTETLHPTIESAFCSSEHNDGPNHHPVQ